MHETQETQPKVVSVRIDANTYKQIKAYAATQGVTVSGALRELAISGLAVDGLSLYSTELGSYLRSVMESEISQIDAVLERRNDEIEDRVARINARSYKLAGVAGVAAVDLFKATFPSLAEVPSAEVYRRLAERSGRMQAGESYEEALRNASKS